MAGAVPNEKRWFKEIPGLTGWAQRKLNNFSKKNEDQSPSMVTPRHTGDEGKRVEREQSDGFGVGGMKSRGEKEKNVVHLDQRGTGDTQIWGRLVYRKSFRWGSGTCREPGREGGGGGKAGKKIELTSLTYLGEFI